MKFYLVAIFLLIGSLARAEIVEEKSFGDWQSVYNKAQKPGDISFCGAVRTYTNAAVYVRVYSDTLDIFFYRNDFAVPKNQELGKVILDFGNAVFLTLAYSSDSENETTGGMYLTPRDADISNVFRSIKHGKMLEFVFPNNSVYEVDLAGSTGALEDVSRCWANKDTGPFSKENPFETPKSTNPPKKSNPFDA